MDPEPAPTLCPTCQGNTKLLAHGVVAPFIATRVAIPVGSPTQLRHCVRCSLDYFSYRYSKQEMADLYVDYRSPGYLHQRRSWEPWYSHYVNDSYTEHTAATRNRRAFATQILLKAEIPESIRCAVDVGGDEGQFFPDIHIERRIVCDVSSRPLSEGIERVDSLGELQPLKADLILMSHLLEHLTNPRATLNAARQALRSDGLLYVEVPLDSWAVRSRHRSERYRRLLSLLGRRRRLFIAVDALTGLSRQLRRPVPWFGVVKQSEHINYFNGASLRTLLRICGFDAVADASDPRARMGGLRIGHYGVAARPIAT